MTGRLSEIVAGAAIKRLSAVEARPERSNQHEINGVKPLKEIFGEARQTLPARFLYLSEEDVASDTEADTGFVTWYDSREEHATRSEFRLYFPTTQASSRLSEGDVAAIVRLADGDVLVAFAAQGSTAEHQLRWLFGLLGQNQSLAVADFRKDDKELGFAVRNVLAQLGVDLASAEPTDDSVLETLLARFGSRFPRTDEFSAFSRQATADVDPVADPDGTLIAWLEHEEALFRLLERHLVLDRLRSGFADDVDAFVSFSLSVQNRRKSRVGWALEHHVRAILDAHRLPYSHASTTERASKPDFLFPSVSAYRDAAYPSEKLAMLAVKSTCKDRWRQVLAEADRIPHKHLLTLEAGISIPQTTEMAARALTLVVPTEIQASYSPAQRATLLTVSSFIAELRR